jgi:hypothetical protein
VVGSSPNVLETRLKLKKLPKVCPSVHYTCETPLNDDRRIQLLHLSISRHYFCCGIRSYRRLFGNGWQGRPSGVVWTEQGGNTNYYYSYCCLTDQLLVNY